MPIFWLEPCVVQGFIRSLQTPCGRGGGGPGGGSKLPGGSHLEKYIVGLIRVSCGVEVVESGALLTSSCLEDSEAGHPDCQVGGTTDAGPVNGFSSSLWEDCNVY